MPELVITVSNTAGDVAKLQHTIDSDTEKTMLKCLLQMGAIFDRDTGTNSITGRMAFPDGAIEWDFWEY